MLSSMLCERLNLVATSKEADCFLEKLALQRLLPPLVYGLLGAIKLLDRMHYSK